MQLAESISIPVISNGGSLDIKTYDDIIQFKVCILDEIHSVILHFDLFIQLKTGASSVMVARAAQWNLSVFRKEGVLPIDDVITDYLKVHNSVRKRCQLDVSSVVIDCCGLRQRLWQHKVLRVNNGGELHGL